VLSPVSQSQAGTVWLRRCAPEFDPHKRKGGKSGWAVHRTGRFKTKQEAGTMAKLGTYRHPCRSVMHSFININSR
jgi:hypothetical protein